MSKISTIGAIAAGTLLVLAGGNLPGKASSTNAKPTYPPMDVVTPRITKALTEDQLVRRAERLFKKI